MIAAIGAAITAASVVITGIVSGIAIGLGASGALALTISTLAVGLVGSLAVGAALSFGASLFSPHTNLGSTSPVTFKADPAAGVPYVIGRTGVGGNIVFADTSNDGHNTWLHYFTVLSAGPVDAIESFTANNVPVTFDPSSGVATHLGYNWRGLYASGVQYQIDDGVSFGGSIYICVAPAFSHDPSDPAYWAAAGTYAGPRWLTRMWQLWNVGLQPSVAIPAPSGTGSVPEWGSSNKLSGLAVTRWVLQSDSAAFPTGTPKPLWQVRGPRIYDPRLDSTYPGGSGSQRAADDSTWVWSENPYLHALTWLIGQQSNGARILGLGAPISAIDVAAFVIGANVADANGWTAGGQVFSTDTKWDVLTGMLQAGCGAPMRLGALISCMVNTPRVSIATLTGSDVIAAASVQACVARKDRINRVIPTYRSEVHQWQLVPAVPIEVTPYVGPDGGQRTKGITMPLVQDVNQAAQLARYAIEDSREFGPVSLPCKPQWLGLRPGDCITVDEPEYGLNSQTLLVLDRRIDPQTACPTLTLRSETNGKHAFALGQTGTPPPDPVLTGIDLRSPAPNAPPWAAIGATLTNGGVSVPAIVVTGTMENPAASNMIVRTRLHAGPGTWAYYGAPPAPVASRIEITSLASGAAYDIGLSYLVRGVQGVELVVANVTAGTFVGSGAGSGVTPTAIEWADISASNGNPTSGSTDTQTISGITSAVTLQVNRTGTATLTYSLNGGAPVAIASGGTLMVSNGDTLSLTATATTVGTDTGVITVINNSDSGATIDAPAYSLTVSNTSADGEVLFSQPAGGSFSYTVDSDAPGFVDIEIWGGGGGGGRNASPDLTGFGAGGGGYAIKARMAVTPGTTVIAGSIGGGGAAGYSTSGGTGGDSTVTSPAMTAHGGTGGGSSAPGIGGSATGGTTDTAGSGGAPGANWSGGGAGNGGGNQAHTGSLGTSPGGGGSGGVAGHIGGPGQSGLIIITART